MSKRDSNSESLESKRSYNFSIEEMDLARAVDRQYIRDASIEVSDEQLKEAIRSGLTRGKQMNCSRRSRRVAVRASVVVMGLFLLLAAFTRVSPAFASVLNDIPLFNKFVQLIDYDSTLRSAADNEFMQTVGVSDTHNGRTFTVHFIMTDGQRLVLFYSLKGAGISDSSHLDTSIIRSVDGKDIPAGYSYWFSAEEDAAFTGEKYDKVDIRIQPGMTLPDRIVLEAEYEKDRYQVEFGIDQSIYASMLEEYDVDQVFRVGEQSYRVGKVSVTPLQAEVQIEEEPGNTKQTHGLIGLALVDEAGNRWTSNMGSGSTSYFYSSYYNRPKHLTLVADGAYQTEAGRKLVIDTDKLKTIETPDKRLQLLSAVPSKDGEELVLTFELNDMNETEGIKGYTLFDQAKPFTDAAGGSTYLLGGTRMSSSRVTDADLPYSELITYSIPNKPYKQPLTFELYEYPGYVLQQVKIPIR